MFFCGANASSAFSEPSAALGFPNYLSVFNGVCVGSGLEFLLYGKERKGKMNLCVVFRAAFIKCN